jgi:uncharacterized protein YcgI (DUF1989 family)
MTDTYLPRAVYPFAREHYETLVANRAGFRTVSEHLLETSGYGFRVEPGQVFRLTLATGPQVLDVCMMNADDPHEHLFPGTQMAIEGGRIGRFTRLWGTPPNSRPLATCIADSVRGVPSPRGTGEHFPHGAHCNPHLWQLYAGKHSRPCYDNLRYALAMLGLNQRYIHDNLNLFMKGGYDAVTGVSIADESDAMTGDYLEFYAETALNVAVSLCPAEAGSDDLRESWSEDANGAIAVNPVTVTILDTGLAPLGWPLAEQADVQ